MRIIRDLESVPPDGPVSAVALGVFDGVHLGHQSILKAAVRVAREGGLEALACTFDPHPMQVLRPELAPAPITTLEDRLGLIAATGIETAVVLAFTPSLAATEAEAFVKDVLLGRLRAREVVVGFNHTFGRGARGNPRLLEALGERLGFTTHVVPPLYVDGVQVSSTGIRAALARGDVELAGRHLGRSYSLVGRVVRGAGRGRALGFPTANLETGLPLLLAAGVYAAYAETGGARHPAVVNVGTRPTFGERTTVIEAHLLDFSGVLYDGPLRLSFVRRLRDERRFPDAGALRRQIERDIAAARACL